MFDDHPTQPNNQTPPNLPVGEPDDIFSRVDADSAPVPPPAQRSPLPEPQSVPQPAAPAEPSALDAGVLRPKSSPQEIPPAPQSPQRSSVQLGPMPAQQPSYQQMPDVTNQINSPSSGKKVLLIVGVIVLVLAVFAGGVWAYMNMNPSSAPNPTNAGTLPSVNIGNTDSATQPNTDSNIIIPDNDKSSGGIDDSAILFGEPVDTDGDGLTDEEEMALGTDPKNWDTDSDNLSDGDEVIWKTDPLNPDTDGDTFLDGDEVKNGYSPTGPGRIFEPPTTIGGAETESQEVEVK